MSKKEQIIEEVAIEEKAEVVQAKSEISQDIVINDPIDLRTDLPLVVQLPPDASKAQIAYARMLNAYAYQNPKKWAMKKDDVIENGVVKVKGFITKLKELKNAPDPIENTKVRINNSGI